MQRNNGMQLAAGLCLMIGAFPVWYWFCAWAVEHSGMPFAFTGGSLGLTAIVWLHRRYGFPLERKSLLLAGLLARVVAVLAGVGGYFLAHLFLSQTASVITGILIWMIYLTGWGMLKLPADKLLSVHAFILVCAAYFIGLLLCRLQEIPSGDSSLLVLGMNAAVFVILRNRLMLREATAGRQLPKGFFRHNLGLLMSFLLPGAAVFSCRRQITALAGSILKAIWSLMTKVLKLLSALLFRSGASGLNESARQPLSGHHGIEWLGWIITLGFAGLALFVLIRFRSELRDFLRQIVSGMFLFVRRLMLARAPAPAPETHPEYTDSAQLLDTLPAHARHAPDRSWRQYYRKYQRTTDPAEKFRAGYAFWMKALRLWHTEVPPNAVPARLLELSSGIPDQALTASVTEIYYKVRYGGHTPTMTEMEEMARLAAAVRKMLLTVHHHFPES